MKNYDGSPKLQNSRAVAKTTWLELEQSAHSVIEALERENPNYLILNENVTSGIQYYSNQTLYDADVIHIGYDLSTSQSFILYSGSALRLHRGLLAKRDPTYVFFGNQNEWLLIGGSVEDYTAGKYPTVDKLYQSLSINNPTTVWVIDLNKTYSSQNWLVSPTDSGILEVDFELQPSTSAAIPTLNAPAITNALLTRLSTGWVIICNTLEENEPISRYSGARLVFASYLFHPRGISAGYWIPQPYITGTEEWQWLYTSHVNENGSSTWFIFNTPPIRFVPRYDVAGQPVTGDYKYKIATTLYSWVPGTTTNPKWMFQGLNTVPWFNQSLLYRTYTNILDVEEEIFVDDEFKTETAVFDGYTNPSYVVNIKGSLTILTYLRFF